MQNRLKKKKKIEFKMYTCFKIYDELWHEDFPNMNECEACDKKYEKNEIIYITLEPETICCCECNKAMYAIHCLMKFKRDYGKVTERCIQLYIEKIEGKIKNSIVKPGTICVFDCLHCDAK